VSVPTKRLAPMKGKILIADDDPVARHILSAMLESAKYEVISKESGRACIEEMRQLVTKKVKLEAIFLDLQLSDMRGTDVLAAIRDLEQETLTPVIMLSANTKAEMLEDEPQFLPDQYLEKPFRTEDVLGALGAVQKKAN